jgi:2-oxoglutarate dehydrogenase E1 component
MTPKSLLRHPKCVSKTKHLTEGIFKEMLDDNDVKNKKNIERILVCSGKIYYEILDARESNPDWANVPVVRMEQLYPFPYEPLKKIMSSYPKLKEVIWTQEEPQNMGSWHFVLRRFTDILTKVQSLSYAGRKNSGTPAEGSLTAHVAEQKRLIADALTRASQSKTIKKAKA